MSRRGDPADILGGIVADMLKMLLLGLGFLIAWIWSSFQKSPEQKLQELTPTETWGGTVTEIKCPHCGAANEAGTGHCYSCGQVLPS